LPLAWGTRFAAAVDGTAQGALRSLSTDVRDDAAVIAALLERAALPLAHGGLGIGGRTAVVPAAALASQLDNLRTGRKYSRTLAAVADGLVAATRVEPGDPLAGLPAADGGPPDYAGAPVSAHHRAAVGPATASDDEAPTSRPGHAIGRPMLAAGPATAPPTPALRGTMARASPTSLRAGAGTDAVGPAATVRAAPDPPAGGLGARGVISAARTAVAPIPPRSHHWFAGAIGAPTCCPISATAAPETILRARAAGGASFSDRPPPAITANRVTASDRVLPPPAPPPFSHLDSASLCSCWLWPRRFRP